MLRKSTPRRVTIKDIAKQAGVSKTAVSFAFNMPGRLSEETTQHILSVAKELGYTPNPIARSLNTRRTNALGIIVPQGIPDVLSNPFFASLMSGIGQVCKAEGMSLMMVPPVRGSMVEATYAALIDGCIVTGIEPNDSTILALRQRSMPFVMIDVDSPDNIASVTIDDCEGARLAMMHLLDQGHRHIAILSFESPSGNIDDYAGTLKHRFDGIRAALATRQLTLQHEGISVLECACNVTGGINALSRIMELRPRPTAVFALSDVIAYGVLEAARTRGLSIPSDLSVIGFDDLETSCLTAPMLTTIRQPILEKGRRAADMLMEMLKGEVTHEHLQLPVELIVRESTRKI